MTKTAIRSASYNQTLALAESFETLSHTQTEILNIVDWASPFVRWSCPDTAQSRHWTLIDKTILRHLVFQIDFETPDKPPIVNLSNAMLASDCICKVRTVQLALRRLEAGGWLLRRYLPKSNWRYARDQITDPPGIDLRPLIMRLGELQKLIDEDRLARAEKKQAILKPQSEILIHGAMNQKTKHIKNQFEELIYNYIESNDERTGDVMSRAEIATRTNQLWRISPTAKEMFERYGGDLLLFVKALIPTFANRSLRPIVEGSNPIDVLSAAIIATERRNIENPAGYFRKLLKNPDFGIEEQDVLNRLEQEVSARNAWRAEVQAEHDAVADDRRERAEATRKVMEEAEDLRGAPSAKFAKKREKWEYPGISPHRPAEHADVLNWYEREPRLISQTQAYEVAKPIIQKGFRVKTLFQSLDQMEFNEQQSAALGPAQLSLHIAAWENRNA